MQEYVFIVKIASLLLKPSSVRGKTTFSKANLKHPNGFTVWASMEVNQMLRRLFSRTQFEPWKLHWEITILWFSDPRFLISCWAHFFDLRVYASFYCNFLYHLFPPGQCPFNSERDSFTSCGRWQVDQILINFDKCWSNSCKMCQKSWNVCRANPLPLDLIRLKNIINGMLVYGFHFWYRN